MLVVYIQPILLRGLTMSDLIKKQNKLEEHFKEVVKEINIKLRDAAKLINEANNLAKKNGLNGLCLGNMDVSSESLDEEDVDKILDIAEKIKTEVLCDAMENAGWNSSGFYC